MESVFDNEGSDNDWRSFLIDIPQAEIKEVAKQEIYRNKIDKVHF